jgi:signal transduction histidine kinase/DNA-binding NarL/FixJ family response regulator
MFIVLSANSLGILGIFLFTSQTFNIKNKMKLLIYGYLAMVLLPAAISYFIMISTNDYDKPINIFIISGSIYGMIYWVILSISFFNKKNQEYKDRWKLFIFIGITSYYIFYSTYPILYILQFNSSVQMLVANIGVMILVLMSALALTTNFNKEHEDLKELTSNLEQKVIDRTRQIEDANKQKTDAFINISHEIKTPLTLISNYLENYIKKNNNSSDLDIVKNNVDKLKRDIINVLDFEKLEKGMPNYDHSQIVDLSEIITMNANLFKEMAIKKGIDLKFTIDDKLYSKIAPGAIDRITNNLIDNAIKYTETKGKIDISLKGENENLTLTVTDTGIGISKEMQEHIFKPYFQVSHKKSNIQGIGMGLSIVKKIVEDVGGQILIDSQQGKGSTFKIIFTRYDLKEDDTISNLVDEKKPTSFQQAEIKLNEMKYDDNKKTIFLVEDNLQMLAYIHNELLSDYNIINAINGKEGLDKLKSIKKPDIIISDIMMDVMDGYEFFEELKKDNDYNTVPFIFLTAKLLEDDKIKGLKKGAVDYITKPFNIDELKAKLKSLLKVTDALRKEKIDEFMQRIFDALESNEKLQNKKRTIEDENPDIDNTELFKNYGISRRQSEIVSLLDQGYERKEIADILKIDLGTVKTHIDRMYKKFEVNNKTDLLNIIKKSK